MTGARHEPSLPGDQLEHRMSTVEVPHRQDRAHITVDDTKCRDCSVRGCITACPADLFVPTGRRHPVQLRAMLRCGTCYLVCNESAITWTYPKAPTASSSTAREHPGHPGACARRCVREVGRPAPRGGPRARHRQPLRARRRVLLRGPLRGRVALRLGEAWDARTVVVCAGPPAADAGLRDLLAAGADRALRGPARCRRRGRGGPRPARRRRDSWPRCSRARRVRRRVRRRRKRTSVRAPSRPTWHITWGPPRPQTARRHRLRLGHLGRSDASTAAGTGAQVAARRSCQWRAAWLNCAALRCRRRSSPVTPVEVQARSGSPRR